jgi:hypothetical protein
VTSSGGHTQRSLKPSKVFLAINLDKKKCKGTFGIETMKLAKQVHCILFLVYPQQSGYNDQVLPYLFNESLDCELQEGIATAGIKKDSFLALRNIITKIDQLLSQRGPNSNRIEQGSTPHNYIQITNTKNR